MNIFQIIFVMIDMYIQIIIFDLHIDNWRVVVYNTSINDITNRRLGVYHL